MKNNKEEKATIRLQPEYNLLTKYHKEALIPKEAIDENWMRIRCQNNTDFAIKDSAVFKTTDGHLVNIKMIGISKTDNGYKTDCQQTLSENIYGLDFDVVLRNWVNRLGYLCGFWYWIEMTEVKK